MSFDVFVANYRQGKPVGMSRDQVIDAFGGALRLVDPDRWEVNYDSANSCELYVSLDSRDAVTSFMVARPCADLRLWDSLFAVMRLDHAVLYFPGCTSVIVASQETAQHLPAGMGEALGGVECVSSGQQIIDRIRSS